MIDFELALPLGALAFYCYDSVLLAYGNELFVIHGRRRWRAEGASTLHWWGKRLALPAAFQPWCTVHRAYWSELARPEIGSIDWPTRDFLAALVPLRWLCSVLLLILLVPLPLASLLLGAGPVLLAVFTLYYVLLLLGLAWVYRRREALALDARAMTLLCVDVLACAPWGVNLVRKLSLRLPLRHDPLQFARQHCDAAANAALKSLVAREASTYLQAEEPGTPREQALRRLVDSLSGAAQ